MNNGRDNKPTGGTICVSVLDQGAGASRPATGVCLRENVYELPIPSDYDAADEQWEFPPGSVVECKPEKWRDDVILVARSLAVR